MQEQQDFFGPKFEDQTLGIDSQVPLRDLCIWVDPIDGSKSLKEDCLQHITNLIGITVKGRPKFGVVARPFVDANVGRIYLGNIESGLFHYETNYTDGTTS